MKYFICLLLSYNFLFAQPILISGSNTMYPLLKSLSASFERLNPIEIRISGEGTSAGIEDFKNKRNDIAMLSRKLRSNEISELKLKNIEYEIFPIALDALCIITNGNLKTESLTLAELENIYNGKIKNWSNLGGEELPIKPIIRDNKSGTADYFKETIMKNSIISPSCMQFSNTSSIIYAISASREYVGYAGCAFIDEQTKALSIKINDENIEPSVENIKSQKYPLTRELYLIYSKNCGKIVSDFIAYCKSESGKKLIESNGFLLLK
ncbi:MAG: PstS family phosphate ABC transporter substrate-binding protein [Bacteroidetes bacterium]|nr:MAG: PstS family phosphate ABC transporter substrate-binding protein [Bacteroidota bacterium]